RARLLAGDLPRHDVRVVLELGRDDLVAGAEPRPAPRAGDEIDRFGRPAHEDDLARRLRVDEPLDRRPRGVVLGGRALAERVDPALHVGVLVLVEPRQPIEDDPRLLRGRGVVEIDERLPVKPLVQQRKIAAAGGYSATPFSRRMFHTFSGVIGMSMCVTPRCASASTTALAIAGGAPTVADSPTPLAPNGWCGDGVTVLSVSQFGVSTAVGSR